MSAGNAYRMFDLAERALRSFGACNETRDLYTAAQEALAEAGQTYLADVARERAGAVDSLL